MRPLRSAVGWARASATSARLPPGARGLRPAFVDCCCTATRGDKRPGDGAPEESVMLADEHGVPDVTAIPRLDTDGGSLRDLDFGSVPVGEPVLTPDRECGEGCLLSLVQRAGEHGDSGRTALQVRNAADLSIAAESMLPPVVPLASMAVGCRGRTWSRRSTGSPGSRHETPARVVLSPPAWGSPCSPRHRRRRRSPVRGCYRGRPHGCARAGRGWPDRAGRRPPDRRRPW